MPFSYVVHKDLRLVVGTGYKRLSWSEIKLCQDLIQSDPDFNAQFDKIVDLRSVTGFAITTEQGRWRGGESSHSLQSVLLSLRILPFSECCKCGKPSLNCRTITQIRVFYELSLALKWLRSEALPASTKSEPRRTETHKSMSAELEES